MHTLATQFAYVALIAVLMPAHGCQRDLVKAPYAGRQDMLSIRGYRDLAVEGRLHDVLVFSEPRIEAASEIRPMRVSVSVRSIHDPYGLSIQYQYTFYNNMMHEQSSTGWRFAHLPPRMQRHLEANALDSTAVKYRLEVRSAR